MESENHEEAFNLPNGIIVDAVERRNTSGVRNRAAGTAS